MKTKQKPYKARVKKTGIQKIAPTEIVNEYTASIKIFGTVFTSTGLTLKEAVENLKVGKVGGVCVMIVTHGEAKREKILNGGQLFKLFSTSRVMHEVALKGVLNMFGDI